MTASEFPSVRGARRQVERDFVFFRKMLAEYEAAEREKMANLDFTVRASSSTEDSSPSGEF